MFHYILYRRTVQRVQVIYRFSTDLKMKEKYTFFVYQQSFNKKRAKNYFSFPQNKKHAKSLILSIFFVCVIN